MWQEVSGGAELLMINNCLYVSVFDGEELLTHFINDPKLQKENSLQCSANKNLRSTFHLPELLFLNVVIAQKLLST